MTLPLLVFTSGDPAGVGPEVALKALRHPAVRRACRALAAGPRRAFESAGWTPSLCPLLETEDLRPVRPARGPSAEGGRTSFEAVRLAARLCLRGLAGGMVTAPVSKQSWELAGVPFLDHTDFLLAETRAPRIAMWLEGGGLRAVLATRHVPLRDVPKSLTSASVLQAAELAYGALREDLGMAAPRIGLCALNPHAGDEGIIGREEARVLAPAVRRLRLMGVPVRGPIPADAAWAAHSAGRFDALIAAYHDQALIPLKLRAGYAIVNWTLGVPLVRTSPGHGTAYDIAGKGKADPSGMIQAALLAAKIAARRGSRGS